MLDEEMKTAMQARCVSFTFLPRFKNVIYSHSLDVLDNVFIGVSNPKVMRADNTSRYDLEERFKREYQGRIVPLLLDLYEGGDIFLAQDNDAGGNMMASLLRYKLREAGIPTIRIKRLIGAEKTRRDGNRRLDMYMGQFYPDKLLARVLDRYRREYEDIRKYGIIDKRLRKGYRNIVSLKEVFSNDIFSEEIKKASNGLALATYLVNGVMLNEQS